MAFSIVVGGNIYGIVKYFRFYSLFKIRISHWSIHDHILPNMTVTPPDNIEFFLKPNPYEERSLDNVFKVKFT